MLLKVRTKSGSLIITQTKALKRDQITSVEHRNLGIIFGEAIIGVCFDLPGVRVVFFLCTTALPMGLPGWWHSSVRTRG